MKFDARIDGTAIRCTITSDRALTAPVFCFSCMAPMVVIDGGTRVHSLGGYTEIALPDLAPGRPHTLTIAHENPDYAPANRAWLTLGPYLRTAEGPLPLPALPAGVRRSGKAWGGTLPVLRLCPQPRDASLTGETLACRGIDNTAEPIAAADALARRCGMPPLIQPGGVPLRLEDAPDLAPEAHDLIIAPDGITLRHADRAGAFYGAVTLLTLIHTHDGQLPCGTISDAPRFQWRGQHLDCARHFYSVDTILRLLDLMALLKLNRFHWHFADDEAFRLELDSLPELSATHYRGEGELIPGVFGGGIRSGGSYSRADADRVVAHARALNIEVMPEIEVPAHALALARVFPDTRDPLENGAEVSVQGYPANVMNPAQPESWRVWEAMADEVAEIFPFSVLHLGCDELPHGTWGGSPAARKLMEAEGLDGTDDLQGWTMNRLASRLVDMGKTPAAWEEAARGKQGIGNDAILFSWTGQGPGIAAARDGYKVVMTPGQHHYLDMAHTGDPDDWGASWAAIIGLEDTINWDPVPADEPELEANIIGVQGTFWSEFTTRDTEMEPMLAPRILGVATMGWQAKGTASAEMLRGLATCYDSLWKTLGWAAAEG
ncbi:glycosyl hydrolase [Loktanella sp. IMCC34160]|uniref:beta-N-acetylhexosaminidase n=1 Tax=Loktanella sp. IMCC34160 TaxID=2510646 RepID=UPI00101C975E|nr:family 20 glycosylhydrolase [Loktanella sp. IMCC34160]RYG93288.1 glycosyl hydrolase [Loktanella sp. IMCC34160]